MVACRSRLDFSALACGLARWLVSAPNSVWASICGGLCQGRGPKTGNFFCLPPGLGGEGGNMDAPGIPRTPHPGGFVYLAISRSMPRHYKVGSTQRNPFTRMDELSDSTSVPLPVVLVSY